MDCQPKNWPLKRGGHCGEVAVSGGSNVKAIQWKNKLIHFNQKKKVNYLQEKLISF